MTAMKLRMKEIGEQAGVSAATVSRIVNGNATVSPEKRERVMNILSASPQGIFNKRMRYGGRKYIGFLLLPGSIHDMRVVAQKILTVSEKLSSPYALRIIPRNLQARELHSLFLHGELSGLLLCGHTIGTRQMQMVIEKIPHVWLNSYQLEEDKPVILMGNEYAGRLAATYLLQHGCRRCGVLTLPNANPGFGARISGFQLHSHVPHISLHDIQLNVPTLPPTSDNLLPPQDMLEKAIADAMDCIPGKTFPDGIFSPEEALTPPLYRYLHSRHLRKFPLVISCNCVPELLSGLFPRPATIDLHPETLAELAVNELLQRLRGEPCKPDNVAVVIQPQLVPGELPKWCADVPQTH